MQGTDVRDVLPGVALVLALQEHSHIDRQVNDFSIDTYIVVAKDNGFGNVIFFVAQDIVQR